MEETNYNSYLSNLLDNSKLNLTYQDNLKLDMYLTLLSLNNNNYNDTHYQNEINVIEDFLRKVNNLKVKIQLNRKELEINNLLDEIKQIYQNNKTIIDKYNIDNEDIINIIDTKEPVSITKLIDKLTKLKINKIENKHHYDNLRNEVISNIFITNHYLNDNTLYIGDNFSIDITEFYQVFEYLLDINNYQEKNQITESIINYLTKNEVLNNYIPVVLTNIFTNNNLNYDSDTSKFNIDNIRITELYSLANNNQNQNSNTAKWKNISIPNEYLYQKIKSMVNTGKYYFNNNIFIMEITNDFKISILVDDLITFLKSNLNNNITITKHI